ncbi:hypothetical protein PV08_07519 [Exophiala spinifera]|uniref:Bicarbonate transporter-like transmembrane domain-containing protein n=1 Tax=Exophiala spinifera TaxID=91928 RepID=A0A0D2B7S4_9EURO|nr:uncharacterized protein PV08_07519 [Exophiala spinifera]KIW14735.1 hypothetical protein PV08_07519 [Exophiala spinifera]
MTTQTEVITRTQAGTTSSGLRRSSTHSAHSKPWERTGHRVSLHSNHSSRPDPEEVHRLSEHVSRQTTRSSHRRTPKWYKIRWFRGMISDVKRRAPYYWSDWKDAWDYRVVPATVYMYFANILPALAFSLDMFTKTHNSYGVNEVLLSSVMACVIFSLFAAQPLVIVGVTGPITVFSYTVYDIVVPNGTNYFAFMAWIGIWSLLMHWLLAVTNSCNALTYVTRFSCDTFGFYVAFIYLQKGIQVLTRQWGLAGGESAYLSVMVSLLVLGFAYGCGVLGNSNLLHHIPRKFIEDYGTPLTIIFFTGFVHTGHMKEVRLETLPTSKSFFPTADRGWFVHFWDISVGEVFLAIPFAILLTILFWFDHNVSSLIAQGSEFPLRKPPGFHWDIFLLGLTTGIAGLLGIPFPNGLIPQAPFHTTALCATRQVADEKARGHTVRVVDHVVEQRVSNLAQGLLFLITMSGPLLIVLHLIPQGVLAGLFFVMGVQALEGNGITQKLLYLARDKNLTDATDPLARIDRQRAIWIFVAIELLGFGATFAISQTIAAIGFPVFLILLIVARSWLMPKWFRDDELRALDAPTAGSFVMESVGGAYGEIEEATPDPRTPENEVAVVDDTLERGESYELETSIANRKAADDGSVLRGGGSARRRPSHSEMQRPPAGMKRRSRSSLNT